VTTDSDDTAAKASIGDVSGCADRVDAQVREMTDLGSGQQPAVLGGRYVPDRRIGILVATIL